MNFFCEYCGCRINAEKDAKCPNCGASYKQNKKFIELEQKKKETEEFVEQVTKETFYHVKNTFKTSKCIFIVIVIMVILIFGFAFFSMFSINDGGFEKNGFKSITTTVHESAQNENSEHIEETSENLTEINISDEIVKMRMKLEQLRQKKKSLENDNENLTCKINDLRMIIERISNEN